jgi:quinoprotein glucose dehydrogenase
MRIGVAIATVIGLAGIGAAQIQRSVWEGVYTADQAKRGQARYKELCASCHGESLEGGESSPPLAGGEFLANWNTLTVGDLFDRTRTTMPQNKPGSLNRETTAEILAFVLGANQFPEGKQALPQASEVLKEIRIEAIKPDRKE